MRRNSEDFLGGNSRYFFMRGWGMCESGVWEWCVGVVRKRYLGLDGGYELGAGGGGCGFG